MPLKLPDYNQSLQAEVAAVMLGLTFEPNRSTEQSACYSDPMFFYCIPWSAVTRLYDILQSVVIRDPSLGETFVNRKNNSVPSDISGELRKEGDTIPEA